MKGIDDLGYCVERVVPDQNNSGTMIKRCADDYCIYSKSNLPKYCIPLKSFVKKI